MECVCELVGFVLELIIFVLKLIELMWKFVEFVLLFMHPCVHVLRFILFVFKFGNLSNPISSF